jgi:cytochrome P450
MDTTTIRAFPFGTQNGIDEDPTLRHLREHEPVSRIRTGNGGQAWLVTRIEDVRKVEGDPRFSKVAARKPGVATISPSLVMTDTVVNLDPPDHSRVRRLLASAFNPRRIERLRPRIGEIVDDLLDTMEQAEQPFDLFNGFAYPLPLTVIGELLGMPYSDNELYQRWLRIFLAPGNLPPAEVRQAFLEQRAYITKLLETKRAWPADDLLTAMIEAREDGERLRDDELLANAEMLVLVGQDTTANMLANSMITLFRHPDQLALLQRDPSLVPEAVEELLRFVPTTIGSPTRVATEDLELSGVTIRAGDAVITNAQAANRDPAAFTDPDRLDVTRSPRPNHVAFGHGLHFCLGATLARAELEIALGELLRRFPSLRLAGPDQGLRWVPNQILYRIEELPVAW